MKEILIRLKKRIFLNKIIVIGIIISSLYWIAEVILHILIFKTGDSFYQSFFPQDINEFFMRSVIFWLIISLSLISQYLINKYKDTAEKLRESEENSRNAYNRAEFYKDIFLHDINNLLHTTLSGIQLNEKYIGDPEKLEKLKKCNKIIKDQVMRGAELVSNIHKLSKLEGEEISIVKVEVCPILEKSIKYAKNFYQSRNVTIHVDSIGNKLYVQANELLEDLFENILVNGIKYNENPIVKILVKISKEKRTSINYLKMEFKDNGIGINDYRKNIIFQSEYSKETSEHGMGIGLSLVKKVIENYNGKIWVEDSVKGDSPKGSNFIILIPEAL